MRHLSSLCAIVLCAGCDDGGPASDAGLDSEVVDVGLDSAGDDAGDDAGLDAAIDGGSDAGTDGGAVGDGMRCTVLADYAPTDIATLGAQRFLAAGERLVRVDLSFGGAVEELVADDFVPGLTLSVRAVHATATDVFAILDGSGASDSHVLVREGGAWTEVTPPAPSSRHRLGGTSVAFVSNRLELYRWDDGWTPVGLPPSISDIDEFTAVDDAVHLVGPGGGDHGSIWTHDGSTWSETPLDPLGVAPSGPPLPPIDGITIGPIEALADGALIFTYAVRRTSGPGEDGVAILRDGVFTKLGPTPAGHGRITQAGSEYLFVADSSAFTSPDGSTWTEVPTPSAFPTPIRSPDFSVTDGDRTFVVLYEHGIYELAPSGWELRATRENPARLLDARPDARLDVAAAYGMFPDLDADLIEFATWDGSGWVRTGVEAPTLRGAWVGDTLYYLPDGVDAGSTAPIRRWTAGSEELLSGGSFDHVVATDANVYGVRRVGILSHELERWTGSGWTSLPNYLCTGGVVTAGVDGLVVIGCDDSSGSGDFFAIWLSGGEWMTLAHILRMGHIGGPSGTAVFSDEAAGTFPTYDGDAWSVMSFEWVGDRPSFVTGPDPDNLLAHYSGHLVWNRAGSIASLTDRRLDRVAGAVVHEDRVIVRAHGRSYRSFSTFDCVPEP